MGPQLTESAHIGHLDLGAINGQGLQEALTTLSRTCLRQGYQLVSHSTSQLQEYETSVVFDANTIHVVVHIPVVSPKDSLTLYKFISAPLITNLQTQPQVYLQVTPKAEYIAIDQRRTSYIPITSSELNSCNRDGRQYFCPHASRMKGAANSCIYALFTNNLEKIKLSCEATFTTVFFEVTRIDACTWFISQNSKESLLINCGHQTPIRKTIEGNTLIKLGPGCTANTKSISIQKSSFEAHVMDISHIHTPALEPSIWYRDFHPTHLSEALKSMLTKVGSKVPASEVHRAVAFQKQLEDIKATYKPWSFHTISHSLTSSLTTLLLLLLISTACWISCRYLLPFAYKKLQKPESNNEFQLSHLNAQLNPPENNSSTVNSISKQNPKKEYLSISDLFPETNPDTPN